MNDVFQLLSIDHARMRAMYRQSHAAGGPLESGPIFEAIRQELDYHLHIEETILYPSCEKHEELKRTALELLDEHHAIREMMLEVTHSPREDATIDFKLRILMTEVNLHLRREEGKLFALARKVMRRWELDQLEAEVASARRRMGLEAYGAEAGR